MLWWIQNPPKQKIMEHLFTVVNDPSQFDKEVENCLARKQGDEKQQ